MHGTPTEDDGKASALPTELVLFQTFTVAPFFGRTQNQQLAAGKVSDFILPDHLLILKTEIRPVYRNSFGSACMIDSTNESVESQAMTTMK